MVEKPQLRYVPEVTLECFRTYAMGFDTPRLPIYVIHKSFFEDETVVFRHGMDGIYSIDKKMMVLDVIMPVDRGDFPLSTLDHALSQGIIDPTVFGRSFSFLDDQFDLYQFRNTLASHFYEALSGGKGKRSFRFKMYCKPSLFFVLVQQQPQQHVDILQPKFRGHSGGSILTHDSIFKIVSPSTEAILEFESVDLLFNLTGSFFIFGH